LKDGDVLVPPDDVVQDQTALFAAHLVPGAQQRKPVGLMTELQIEGAQTLLR
jgi:hypothetical protein